MAKQSVSDARTFESIARWLGDIADAAAEGAVVLEEELDDGCCVVLTKWPTKTAYFQHRRNLWTIAAVVSQDRAARAEDAAHHRRRVRE